MARGRAAGSDSNRELGQLAWDRRMGWMGLWGTGQDPKAKVRNNSGGEINKKGGQGQEQLRQRLLYMEWGQGKKYEAEVILRSGRFLPSRAS